MTAWDFAVAFLVVGGIATFIYIFTKVDDKLAARRIERTAKLIMQDLSYLSTMKDNMSATARDEIDRIAGRSALVIGLPPGVNTYMSLLDIARDDVPRLTAALRSVVTDDGSRSIDEIVADVEKILLRES